jgi:hypothetical protein
MELCATVVAAIPLGVAALLCGCGRAMRRTATSGAAIVAASLVTLELAQVSVFSRTTDSASLLAALAGALVGVVTASQGTARTVVRSRRSLGAPLTLVATWLAVAVLVEWWPFQFVLDPARAGAQMTAWSRAPFRWPAGPFDLVPGMAMAIVAGRWLRRGAAAPFIRLHTVLILGLGGVTFLLFETGRVLLSTARPTLLSVALKTAALAVGLHAHGFPTPVTAGRRPAP